MYKRLLTLICPIIAVNGYGLVEQEINEKAPINVCFAISSLNRVSVGDGAIEKIVGDESLFTINIDDTTGQAFVFLLKEPEEYGSTLTVITRSGYVQDLIVKGESKPSELVILKEPLLNNEEFAIDPLDFQNNTVDFLNTIIEGKIPHGYGRSAIQPKKDLTLPKELNVALINVLEGPFENIFIYRITNTARKPIVLKANFIKSAEDSWVFLTANELASREQTLCIISSKKVGE